MGDVAYVYMCIWSYITIFDYWYELNTFQSLKSLFN